jgi:PEP-CTERM motif-containing protein
VNRPGKYTLLLTVVISVGLWSEATASLTLFDTYKNTPENTAHILAVASARLGESNLMSLTRVEDLNQPPAGSPFTLLYPTSNTADISWDLNGTGFNLVGVYIFGGSNGANLYKVTDAAQMISGSATIHPPVTGNSGQFGDISHTLFLGVAVPEPSSAILLAIGGASLLVWRFRRR